MSWKTTFIVIAHRGASAYAPENTLTAFRKALEMHADAIEFDLRRSRDGVPVVIHDDNLKRVAGVDKKVSDLTVEELKKIKVFGSETIPTFEDVLREFANKIPMFIEIKDEGIEETVVNLMRNYNAIENSIVISFNPNILSKIKELENKIEIGLISNTYPVPIDVVQKIKAFAILPKHTTVTPRVVKEAHARNLKVYTWTINDVSTALKMITMV